MKCQPSSGQNVLPVWIFDYVFGEAGSFSEETVKRASRTLFHVSGLESIDSIWTGRLHFGD